MTPSRGLCAALVASLALVTGCSSSGEAPAASEEPTGTSTWVGAPTTSAEPEAGTDADTDETDEPTSDAEDATDGTEGDGTDGEPVRPRRAPHSVAAHFQNGLFTGDTEICDLLGAAARKDLVRTKVAEGVVAKGSTCEKYVRTIARTSVDWDVTVEARIIRETETSAVVRVDMTHDDEVASTRMELAPAGGTWEITDWGRH